MKTYNLEYGREILLATHSITSRVWNFIVIASTMGMWPVEIPNKLLHVGLVYTKDRSSFLFFMHCEFDGVLSKVLQNLWTVTSYFIV
jgi:hypothetical protein